MSGPATAPRLSAGNEIAGRFRLLSPVANALVGERWRADDGGVPVHLTLLTARPGLSPSDRDATLSALRDFGHPHGVPVFDAGMHQGDPYVVSSLPSGQSLRAWLADHRAREALVSLRDARGIFDQVTQCLAASHRAGVPLVHGSSLVASTYLERRGEVQLVATLGDLGLLMVGEAGAAPLPAGADPRRPSLSDDIQGAGALLAELLTGVIIATNPEVEALTASLTAARPDVDPSVWRIITACIGSDVSARPASMARVRELIRQSIWTPREIRSSARAAAPAVASQPPSPPQPAAPERARIVAVSSTVDRSLSLPTSAIPAVRSSVAASPPAPTQAAAPPAASPPPAQPSPAAAVPAPKPAPKPAMPAPAPSLPVPAPSLSALLAAPSPHAVISAPPIALPPLPAASAQTVVTPAPSAPSPRSFASGATEATVLVVDVASSARLEDVTVEAARSAPPSHEVTRRAASPYEAKVAALPRGARALFDEESTTLHVAPAARAEAQPEPDPHEVTPALGTRADETVEAVARPDFEAIMAREETAPESRGFIVDAILERPHDDAPTLLPLTRDSRPATMAPPTRRAPLARAQPPAPPPQPSVAAAHAVATTAAASIPSVPLVISDAFTSPSDAFASAPRVATMPPPAAHFTNSPPLAPAFFDDHGPSTMPVPVMPSPLPPPRPAPELAPRPPREPPSASLLEPPLVWWLVAAVAGVVTLLAASLLTSR